VVQDHKGTMPAAETGTGAAAQGSSFWAKVGSDWKADGGTVTSSGMLAEERFAVSGVVVSAGVHFFMWKINASALPDGHMFLGVAAASGVTDGEAKCKTWGFSPPTGNLYIGEKLNEHGAEQMKKHFFVDDKESLLGKAVGSSVLMKVDMGAKALSYSINGNEFIEAGIALPEGGVRPWCFLYHEGDSVTIEEVNDEGVGTGGASRPSTAGTDSGIC